MVHGQQLFLLSQCLSNQHLFASYPVALQTCHSALKRYALVQVVAIGSCHSNEGLKLEELALRAEDAKLLLRGGLLGPHQNATLMLTDFPVALLQPLFRWLLHPLLMPGTALPLHCVHGPVVMPLSCPLTALLLCCSCTAGARCTRC